jgi:class 3 adenylate cyclase
VDAERRPITVMFCDRVGSTSLAARLDAEDWRDLVGGYLDDASRAVTQYGGHVLKKLGDGIIALLGYPQAQENDAERAARSARFMACAAARSEGSASALFGLASSEPRCAPIASLLLQRDAVGREVSCGIRQSMPDRR